MKTCFLLTILVSAFSASAGTPQLISQTLSNTGAFYEVPTGKVLLIDCICASATTQVTIGNGLFSNSTGGTATDRDFLQLARPMKLPAGQRITFLASSGLRNFSFWGALIDAEDLYVGIPSRMDQLVPGTSQSLTGSVSFPTRQPALVRIQESEDLETWRQSPSIPQIVKGNETNVQFRADSSIRPKQFYRAKALSR